MKKRMPTVILLSAVIGLGTIGGVSAYLTDYDTASNEFTVGKVNIKLEEPDWDPEENDRLVPGETISKNPQIKNIGVNDAYVYMEVGIPTAEVETADADGKRQGVKNQELFSFDPSEKWTLMESFAKGNQKIYIYTYNSVLKADETTEALFDTMQFANILEGQLDAKTLSIPVKSYAIQTSYTGGESGDYLTKAKAAYQKYVNQNKDQTGKVTEK